MEGENESGPPGPGPAATPAEKSVEGNLPVSMTLENIIDMTGEIEHLNELVLLHLEQCGGFSGTQEYFSTVRPILDELEEEVRVHYREGMETAEIRRIVSTWIDSEIVLLQ